MHNETQSAAPDKKRIVVVEQADAKGYTNSLKTFQQKYQSEQLQFNSSQQTVYYIVSRKFLNSWRDFCMNHEEKRQLPFKMNEDLFDSQTKKLKKGLKEKEDFEFLSLEIYQLFGKFRQNEIKRTSVVIGHEKRIPLYLNEYNYLCITKQDLKQIDQKFKKREDFKLKIIEQSENSTVESFLKSIAAKQQYQKTYDLRLWRIDKKQNLDTLFKYLKTAADRATYQYRIKGFGKLLTLQTKIEDVQIEQGDFFLVQIKQRGNKWFLQAENEKKCEGCYDMTQLKFPCQCQRVAYCTIECKQKDKKFHLRSCEFAQMQELNKPIDMKRDKNSANGVVGLRNLGNTCFMNSCLQCLSNTQPLTTYFLQSLYQAEINKTNNLGTKGKLAKSYAKFIKGMWCESNEVFTPDNIKSAVSSINPMFSGYAQHDSQQFFSFLIDGLHEDLNRVEKKPYVQSVESNNRPDKQVALQSWLSHIKRNQSIITDLMTGQYKSKVTCPTCSRQSITFDPFITVTLPIPQNVVNIFQSFVIFKNFEQKTKRISFGYSKPNVQEWIQQVAKITQIDEKSIYIYLVSINQGIYRAGRESLAQIVYKMQNESKNVFVVQLTQDEINMKNRIQIPGRFSKKGFYQSQYQNLWFKFPFFFDKENTNGLTIYKRMLAFLYNQCYDNSKNRVKFYGSKTYEEYQEIMLKRRPFQIFIRHGKKLDRFYHRLQIKFQEETAVSDSTTLTEIFKNIDQKDCEIDIRFSKAGMQDFSFQKLKDFDDLTKKIKASKQSDQPVDISRCFANLSQSEQLQSGNEWYCSNCKEHKLANKQMSIYKAPKVLILHLKRFKQKGIIKKQKNQSKVEFPLELNMKPFLIESQPIDTYISEAKSKGIYIEPKYTGQYKISSKKEPIYDLYAVSNHYGGLGGGHYTACAKNGEKWYDFNDSSVRSTSSSSIIGSGAYILFYKRRDQ